MMGQNEHGLILCEKIQRLIAVHVRADPTAQMIWAGARISLAGHTLPDSSGRPGACQTEHSGPDTMLAKHQFGHAHQTPP